MLLISRAAKWCRKNRTSTTTMTATIATTTSAAAACLPTGSLYYADAQLGKQRASQSGRVQGS
jgi:hypothetical protein